MGRFVFKLESLLRHRENQERQRQRELAIANAEMVRLTAELRALDGSVRSSVDDVRKNHLIGPLDLQFLAAHRRYLLATERKALALAQQMALAQRQVDQARQGIAEAAKKRKILEKLREKQEREWTAAADRKELAELDDINMRLQSRSDDPAGGAV